MNNMIVGCFEWVTLPGLKSGRVLAKVDTGAYSGAIHCTDIKVVRRKADDKKVLKFKPFGKAALATETTDFMKTYVRSATGHRIKRYVIDTTIEIDGVPYPIRIGLADRSDLKKPVLIGRRFLREHGIQVDVRINQELDDEGEATK